MYFLCVVHVDRDIVAAFTPQEHAAFETENKAYADWLMSSEPAVIAASLHEPETARLIRSRDGMISMTDGPYIETKEHLAGVFIVRVASRDEAIAIAEKCPVAKIGTLEIRQMNYRD